MALDKRMSDPRRMRGETVSDPPSLIRVRASATANLALARLKLQITGYGVTQEANGRNFFVRPLFVAIVTNRLPIRIGNHYFQVDRNGNGLVAHRARREAVLTYGSKNTLVYPGPADLTIFRSVGLPVLSTIMPTTTVVSLLSKRAVSGICDDINFVDQLWSDYSSRNALDLRQARYWRPGFGQAYLPEREA